MVGTGTTRENLGGFLHRSFGQRRHISRTFVGLVLDEGNLQCAFEDRRQFHFDFGRGDDGLSDFVAQPMARNVHGLVRVAELLQLGKERVAQGGDVIQ
ncbi:hypothetical protein APR50_17315 [Variovorax paradoxus]|nr:hypothetical protein APR52_32490 [Variovorax paradoxus]KPV06296.1 hypothetical protein APR50_17315 [Variovorax paradoxus]KPV06715.1 hypothetical protein APR49_19000 [Variovorax paradoxus]KPV20830.1 hypothetical protein APR51_16045 [Variovorax paradoxus]KPV32227.1 hypothetical protein APR48_14045 [Variovorax paradoxus]